MSKFILALRIENPSKYHNLERAEYDALFQKLITAEFEKSASSLLDKYDIYETNHNPLKGLHYAIFTLQDDSLKLDKTEFINTLIGSFQDEIKLSLHTILGIRIGSALKYDLNIFSFIANIEEKEKLETYIEKSFINFPQRVSPTLQINRRDFLEILSKGKINTFFQPIISMESMKTVGFEALSRGPMNSKLNNALSLFKAAANLGLNHELELICIKKALKYLEKLPQQYWLSVNVGPGVLVSADFKKIAKDPKFKKNSKRIIFEITEHLPILNIPDIADTIDELIANGYSFALDDAGCGFIDSEIIGKLKPKIIKICTNVINTILGKSDSTEIIEDILKDLKKMGCQVLVEGIENEEIAKLLEGSGIAFAQGFFFNKPRHVSEYEWFAGETIIE
ncbi:MAG: EAL domain-containing protein [Pseudomonadota bacterium]